MTKTEQASILAGSIAHRLKGKEFSEAKADEVREDLCSSTGTIASQFARWVTEHENDPSGRWWNKVVREARDRHGRTN